MTHFDPLRPYYNLPKTPDVFPFVNFQIKPPSCLSHPGPIIVPFRDFTDFLKLFLNIQVCFYLI